MPLSFTHYDGICEASGYLSVLKRFKSNIKDLSLPACIIMLLHLLYKKHPTARAVCAELLRVVSFHHHTALPMMISQEEAVLAVILSAHS
jgi:hypothetical protein